MCGAWSWRRHTLAVNQTCKLLICLSYFVECWRRDYTSANLSQTIFTLAVVLSLRLRPSEVPESNGMNDVAGESMEVTNAEAKKTSSAALASIRLAVRTSKLGHWIPAFLSRPRLDERRQNRARSFQLYIHFQFQSRFSPVY